MELRDVTESRRMIRHFLSEPLEDEVVEGIVRAGLRAPSAGYSQGCSLLVLRSDEERRRLWECHSGIESPWSASTRRGVMNAPLVLVVLTSKKVYLDRYAEDDKGWTDRDEARWPAPYWYVDAGCTAMLLLLAAVDEGLGALLFGIAPPDLLAFRRSFGIPADVEFVACVAVGRPDPTAPRRDLRNRRRPIEDLVHHGRW